MLPLGKSSQCSTTGVTKVVVCAILSVGMFYLTTHSTHFILRLYGVGHMVHSDSEREETRCRHMGYSFRLAARVVLYALSHRQDSTYHGLCLIYPLFDISKLNKDNAISTYKHGKITYYNHREATLTDYTKNNYISKVISINFQKTYGQNLERLTITYPLKLDAGITYS